MKRLIAISVLLVIICAGLSGCNSGSNTKVFEQYYSIEFSMDYDDLVKLLGNEYEKEESIISTKYIWEWTTSDQYETIYVDFQDDNMQSKQYYRGGDSYGATTALDYEIWESLKVGMDIDTFLEDYGKYVVMTSHSVYNNWSTTNVQTIYEGFAKDGWYTFNFSDGILSSKSYRNANAEDSTGSYATSYMISDSALEQIDYAVKYEIATTYDKVCTLIGSEGVLYSLTVNYTAQGDEYWETYHWWTSSGEIAEIAFLDDILNYYFVI